MNYIPANSTHSNSDHSNNKHKQKRCSTSSKQQDNMTSCCLRDDAAFWLCRGQQCQAYLPCCQQPAGQSCQAACTGPGMCSHPESKPQPDSAPSATAPETLAASAQGRRLPGKLTVAVQRRSSHCNTVLLMCACIWVRHQHPWGSQAKPKQHQAVRKVLRRG